MTEEKLKPLKCLQTNSPPRREEYIHNLRNYAVYRKLSTFTDCLIQEEEVVGKVMHNSYQIFSFQMKVMEICSYVLQSMGSI